MEPEPPGAARGRARILVPPARDRKAAARAPTVAALAGFLLGSLAGISIRTPEAYASDATLLGFVGGGLVGAILGAGTGRVVGDRAGSRTGAVAGSVAGFLGGAAMGILSGPHATAFRSIALQDGDVLPAIYSGAVVGATGVLLLCILWLHGMQATETREDAWTLVLTGALVGGILGTLGGSLAVSFVLMTAGQPGLADASTGGRALLAAWAGSLAGAAVAIPFGLRARLRGPVSDPLRADD